MEGESEEVVRKRIAAEYQNEGVWSKPGDNDDRGDEGAGGDDDDPLDAFMAGIEVCDWAGSVYGKGSSVLLRCSITE